MTEEKLNIRQFKLINGEEIGMFHYYDYSCNLVIKLN